MYKQILPPEVQAQITPYCSSKDLTSLACINSSWTDQAEKALYTPMTLRIHGKPHMSDAQKLESLETRVLFVKTIFLLVSASPSEVFWERLSAACGLIVRMAGLSDLRIRCSDAVEEEDTYRVRNKLNETLR